MPIPYISFFSVVAFFVYIECWARVSVCASVFVGVSFVIFFGLFISLHARVVESFLFFTIFLPSTPFRSHSFMRTKPF